MKTYLVMDLNSTDWIEAKKIHCHNFYTAADRYADDCNLSDHELLNYGLDVQVKCEETGEIKKYEIEANLEFNVMEIVD